MQKGLRKWDTNKTKRDMTGRNKRRKKKTDGRREEKNKKQKKLSEKKEETDIWVLLQWWS